MTTLKAYKKTDIDTFIQSIESFIGNVCRVTNHNFVCRRTIEEDHSQPLLTRLNEMFLLPYPCNFLPKIGNEVFILDVNCPIRSPLIEIILLDPEDIIENNGSMFSLVDLGTFPCSYSLMHDSFEIVPEPNAQKPLYASLSLKNKLDDQT